jgi:AraC-like DNA-binding protein
VFYIQYAGKYIRQFHKGVVVSTGVVHSGDRDGGAEHIFLSRPQIQGYGDPGAAVCRMIDQNGTAVIGGGRAHHRKSQTKSVSAVLDSRFTQIPGENALLNLRFNYAKSLLRSGYYQIKEIALLSGFNDTKYFRVAFKRQFGITPNEYAARFSE